MNGNPEATTRCYLVRERPERRPGPCNSSGNRGRALALTLLCSILVSEAHGQQTVSLEGTVRADGGAAAVQGARVSLETANGVLVSQHPADSDGQFHFESLLKMTYRVKVTADGFQPLEQELDLRITGGKVFVSLMLTPAGKASKSWKAIPAITDNKAPKKAHHEYEEGAKALQAENLSAAEEHFGKAVAAYSCYARAQTGLAVALSSRRDYSGAASALTKAIKCDPGFLGAYVELGHALNAEQKFAESEKVLLEGLHLSPAVWEVYYELAAAHYGLKQYGKAQEDYLKARSLAGGSIPAVFHQKLAEVYLRENAYDQAYAEMQEYLRAEPKGRFADRIRVIMQQMEAAGVLHTARQPASEVPPQRP